MVHFLSMLHVSPMLHFSMVHFLSMLHVSPMLHFSKVHFLSMLHVSPVLHVSPMLHPLQRGAIQPSGSNWDHITHWLPSVQESLRVTRGITTKPSGSRSHYTLAASARCALSHHAPMQ